MKKTVLAGIDVSADSLVVAVKSEQQSRLLTFPNNPAGHKKLCRVLTRGGRSARVCLESTGVYGLDAALALHESTRTEVMVANPRAVSDFAKARFQRSKTDTADAATILEFLERMPFEPWSPPDQEILDLRALSRRIRALNIAISQERNRLHAARRQGRLTEHIRDDIDAHIGYLRASIDRLTGNALEIIGGDPDLHRRFEQLLSIKGVAQTSAVAILAELAVLPPDMDARQWVAHAGLDPRHYESGTSVHKPARISKTGNRRLRAALFMPAMVAVRHEPHVRAFYEKLVARGKKPLQALVAVMRKLLHAIYGMFSKNEDFDGEKFYAMNP
ncbi:MAG: IS110 family transposase [Candidatus Eisenbacteria bacterium]|nr:IS110 family transposase [Candidatus Eisenbacteria bacterium]